MSELSGLRAEYDGRAYEATLYYSDRGSAVTLRSPAEVDEFEPLDDYFVLDADLTALDILTAYRTVATYRRAPVVVLVQDGNTSLVEYAGLSYLEAQEIGFDRIERGVYRRRVPSDDLADRRVDHVQLWPQPD